MRWFGFSRPVLFKESEVYSYIINNFSSNEIKDKLQLYNFFKEVEGLLEHKRVFRQVCRETETKIFYRVFFGKIRRT